MKTSTINRKVIGLLRQLSDDKNVSVEQNKHLKITGVYGEQESFDTLLFSIQFLSKEVAFNFEKVLAFTCCRSRPQSHFLIHTLSMKTSDQIQTQYLENKDRLCLEIETLLKGHYQDSLDQEKEEELRLCKKMFTWEEEYFLEISMTIHAQVQGEILFFLGTSFFMVKVVILVLITRLIQTLSSNRGSTFV